MSEQSTSPEYVGFWLRFLAFIIDSIPAGIIVSALLLLTFGAAPEIDANNLATSFNRLGINLALTAALFVTCWIIIASTPGKLIFGAYIVDAKTLKRASTSQLIIRYLSYYVSLIPLGLGFLWIAFDPRKQGWHDKLAGTVVIKGKPV